jgi:nicotinate-nucleotide adenylyltransferase
MPDMSGRRRDVAEISFRPPPAFPGMCVGIMGGSFNPPHMGHRHIAVEALKRLGLDRVWCLVSPGNPLKSRDELASFGRRLAETSRLLRHPRIEVSGLEAALTSAYTVDTLRFLKQRRHGVHFVWIMGGDNLAGFHRWRRWREIFGLVPVAVFDRPGCRLPALASRAAQTMARTRPSQTRTGKLPRMKPPAWAYLTIPLSDLSSTGLRRGRSGRVFSPGPTVLHEGDSLSC